MGMKRNADNDQKLRFNTGLPIFSVLLALLTYIKSSCSLVATSDSEERKPGRPCTLEIIDDFWQC
jgi:hypothetical protein